MFHVKHRPARNGAPGAAYAINNFLPRKTGARRGPGKGKAPPWAGKDECDDANATFAALGTARSPGAAAPGAGGAGGNGCRRRGGLRAGAAVYALRRGGLPCRRRAGGFARARARGVDGSAVYHAAARPRGVFLRPRGLGVAAGRARREGNMAGAVAHGDGAAPRPPCRRIPARRRTGGNGGAERASARRAAGGRRVLRPCVAGGRGGDLGAGGADAGLRRGRQPLRRAERRRRRAATGRRAARAALSPARTFAAGRLLARGRGLGRGGLPPGPGAVRLRGHALSPRPPRERGFAPAADPARRCALRAFAVRSRAALRGGTDGLCRLRGPARLCRALAARRAFAAGARRRLPLAVAAAACRLGRAPLRRPRPGRAARGRSGVAPAAAERGA